jgi:MoaA/NifB/PqqE/SkfB family radical SAM enzyme
MEPLSLPLPHAHGSTGFARWTRARPSPEVEESTARPPRIAVVFLLPDCNMGCRYCASELGFDTLGADAARTLLDSLRRSGVAEVVLGGGEPYLWPHGLAGLAAAGARLGLVVQVATNGVALPAGWATAEGVSRYILPLDSLDPAQHDQLRRGAGSHHAQVMARLAELAAARRVVTLSTVVTRDTAAGLLDLAGFLARHHAVGGGIHSWHLYRFVPTGRGGRRHARELAIEGERFEAATEAVRQLTLPFAVFVRADLYAARTVEYLWSEHGVLQTMHGPLAAQPWWRPGAAGEATARG